MVRAVGCGCRRKPDPVCCIIHSAQRRLFRRGAFEDGRFVYRHETDRLLKPFDFSQLYRANRASIRRLVLIVDNASYHHARLHKAWREAHADRFILEFLPPYSPELNPIERVWKFTRRRCLHNRYFPRLERVMDAVEGEFASWAHHSPALRRLCAII
jgi:transposase